MKNRVFLVVIDSFGIGEMPDSAEYGDAGSNTFLNSNKIENYNIPNLTKLGLKNIDGVNLPHNENVVGVYAKLAELSKGKDTTTGHFEMMDIITKIPSPTFPNGFPDEVVDIVEKAFNSKVLGNCVASGTEIIAKLGKEHLKTKQPILYTSADSVLQLAVHTDVCDLQSFYKICESIRNKMVGKFAVGRVIARPFKTHENGEFVRISEARRDFSIIPPLPNILNTLVNRGVKTIGVGKIYDIFAGRDITETFSNHTNEESLKVLEKLVDSSESGFVFVNLVDTDMIYGHRNDISGYRKAVEEIDKSVGKIIPKLTNRDVLIITADHGCDPTTESTDHSREYVPFLMYDPALKTQNLGVLQGFNNIGKYILKLFDVPAVSQIYELLKNNQK